MTAPARLVELSLTAFSDRIAERTPTPGGGSVAAHLVELGCALSAMAGRFTSGPKFVAVEPAMSARLEELERLRRAAAPLVDQDTAAYDAVTAAYKLPKATEPEKQARTAAVQAAVLGALDIPARTLSVALAGLRLAAAAAPDLNPNLVSDAASGAYCLASGAEAAFYNVRINAASLADKELAARRLAESERELAEVRELFARTRAAIEARLG
ncbi:MAG: cyclodeaminase/cyclohydrolase family protein [Planctomycetes bacterium]|nr:cyclodeaminase/cyclohydrolase family protein [Planctomycetota bacterium]